MSRTFRTTHSDGLLGVFWRSLRSIVAAKVTRFTLFRPGVLSASRLFSGRISRIVSPLSPLRGEGARRAFFVGTTRLAAFMALAPSDEMVRTRRRALETRRASGATPSPLNGERAGVRGENGDTCFVLPRLAGLLAVSFLLLLDAPASEWQSERGYRWQELKLSASGRSYLQRLPAAATGISFTNYLSEDKAMAVTVSRESQ